MIYRYHCNNCKKPFQVDMPISSKIKGGRHVGVKCPLCESQNVVKSIGKTTIIFRGSGWGKDK